MSDSEFRREIKSHLTSIVRLLARSELDVPDAAALLRSCFAAIAGIGVEYADTVIDGIEAALADCTPAPEGAARVLSLVHSLVMPWALHPALSGVRIRRNIEDVNDAYSKVLNARPQALAGLVHTAAQAPPPSAAPDGGPGPRALVLRAASHGVYEKNIPVLQRVFSRDLERAEKDCVAAARAAAGAGRVLLDASVTRPLASAKDPKARAAANALETSALAWRPAVETAAAADAEQVRIGDAMRSLGPAKCAYAVSVETWVASCWPPEAAEGSAENTPAAAWQPVKRPMGERATCVACGADLPVEQQDDGSWAAVGWTRGGPVVCLACREAEPA